MYLTAERIAIVNQAIRETFENTSVAWQAIPHWDTGDPGQSRVRNDVVNSPGFLRLRLRHVDFQVTLVQTSAPTPDSLVAEVMWVTTRLARRVDRRVLRTLRNVAKSTAKQDFNATTPELLNNLIDARAKVEDAGYRAPSCLITNTQGLKELHELLSAGYPIADALLSSAHVNSLHRTSLFDEYLPLVKPDGTAVLDSGGSAVSQPGTVMVMLGRRQLIAHGGASDASAGEEPVDIAVSVPPSLEVVGETSNSRLELSVRIRFALRVKDEKSLVALYGKPVKP